MILVTGATGQFGSKAIDHLLKKGVKASEISALVRDAAKAQSVKDKGMELRIGNYEDYDSLRRICHSRFSKLSCPIRRISEG